MQTSPPAGELPHGNPKRVGSLFIALAHGVADPALTDHLPAKAKGAAQPEMVIDDLFGLLR